MPVDPSKQNRSKRVEELYSKALSERQFSAARDLANQFRAETGSYPKGYNPANFQSPSILRDPATIRNGMGLGGKEDGAVDPTKAGENTPSGRAEKERLEKEALKTPDDPTVPGGAAYQGPYLKRPKPDQTPQDDESSRKKEPDAAPDNAQNQIKKTLADRARNWAKENVTKNLKKTLTKDFWLALLKSPHFWIVLVIIFLILLAIGLFIKLTSDATLGVNGKTPTQQVSPVEQKDTLVDFALAFGDKDTQGMLSQTIIQEVQQDLLALKEETTDDASIQTLITQALALIDQYLSTGKPEDGLKIIELVKQILEALDTLIPVIAGRYPVNPDDIYTFNSELHFGTPLRPEVLNQSGHGTYTQFAEGKSDAVDVYTKADALIYPAFLGEIVDVSDDGTGHKKIVLKNGDYQMLYANIDSMVNTGDKITDTTKPIGKTVNIEGDYFVHLELNYCGISLTTTPLDKINKEEKQQAVWGEYLWAKMKKTLILK